MQTPCIEAETTTHAGDVDMSGAVNMGSSLTVAAAMTNAGVNVGSTHTHFEHGDGGGETDPPH